MSRLARWWWIRLLRWRGWPDPEASLDWLEHRAHAWRMALIAASDGIPDEYRGIPALRWEDV